MSQVEYELETKFNKILNEYKITGKYKTINSQKYIKMYTLNSLIYLSFDDFVDILEDVICRNLNEAIIDYLLNKLYLEDISHYIQSEIKELAPEQAICTNFVDGRLFLEILNLANNQGCQSTISSINENIVQNKSKINLFGLDDSELYRNILYDDDYLLKQLNLQQANVQQKIINKEIEDSKYSNNTNYSNDNKYPDPYEQIANMKTTHFTEKDMKLISKEDLFCSGNDESFFPTNEELECMHPFENNIILNENQPIYNNLNISYNQYENNKKSSSYSRPRGKQMDLKPSELSDRPFVCKVVGCNRAFKRFEHLKRHSKMHTGEKPFKCKFQGCQREFSRSDNLTAHYKTHNVNSRGSIPMGYSTRESSKPSRTSNWN